MSPLVQLILGILSSLIFAWLLLKNTTPPEARVTSQDDLINPLNTYQIGYLVGMSGGTVGDASVVRYALERFEQTHGYHPTLRDAALVVGLMRGER